MNSGSMMFPHHSRFPKKVVDNSHGGGVTLLHSIYYLYRWGFAVYRFEA
jgi:hypothetical protein